MRPTAVEMAGTLEPSVAALRRRTDRELVELARAGSERAVEAIVDRYRGRLVAYCRARVGDWAEDVVQHTFTQALAQLRDDSRPLELRPWLYRVAQNAIVNLVKRSDWRDAPLEDDLDGVPQPPELVEERERLRTLIGRISGLPERQRVALLQSAFEGRSYEEIAVRTQESETVVRGLLARARSKLREGLGVLVPLPLLRRLLGGTASNAGRASQAGTFGGGVCAAAPQLKVAAVLTIGAMGVGGAEAGLSSVTAAAEPAGAPAAQPATSVPSPSGATGTSTLAAVVSPARPVAGEGESSSGPEVGEQPVYVNEAEPAPVDEEVASEAVELEETVEASEPESERPPEEPGEEPEPDWDGGEGDSGWEPEGVEGQLAPEPVVGLEEPANAYESAEAGTGEL
jgi:RNA polymerase sigma factor (sigma-70 family)